MNKVFIGLGSNLNDPLGQLQIAYQFLKTLPAIMTCRPSFIYRSPPLGPQDQPNFYNAVCYITTHLEPDDLLNRCLIQEQRQHRQPLRHWGERTIDIDILEYGQLKLSTPRLIIPHPEITKRLFVLRPFADLAPHHVLSNGLTVQENLTHLGEQVPPALLPQRIPGSLLL